MILPISREQTVSAKVKEKTGCGDISESKREKEREMHYMEERGVG